MSTLITAALTTLTESLRGLTPAVLLESLRGFSPASLLLQQSPTKTIATAIALLAAYHLYFNELELNKPKQYRNIPKIDGYSFFYRILTTNSFVRQYEYYKKQMEASGIIRVRNLGKDIVLIGSTEFARELLQNPDTYPKRTFVDLGDYHLSTKFLGKANLVFSNGDTWKRHRKIANPAFHKSWNMNVFGIVTARFGRKVDSLTKENGIDIGIDVHKLFQGLTLDIFGLETFGFDFESIEKPDGTYVTIYNHLFQGFVDPTYAFVPILDRYPIGHRAQLHKEMEIFDKLIFDMINAKREQIHQQGDNFDEASADLLTIMIRATEKESPNKGLSARELRDSISIFLLAGHETSANALSCALYYLAINPAVQSKARAEVLSVMGDRDSDPDPDTIPTLEQTKSFGYINLVIKETMRLSPSVVELPARTVDKDTLLGEYLIPKNSHILLNVYSIQHNPKYWGKDVEEFRPERFEEENKRDALAWLPFSSGSRICIGMNFSLFEQRVVLSMLLRKYEFSLPPDSPSKNGLEYSPGSLVHPLNLRIQFHSRF